MFSRLLAGSLACDGERGALLPLGKLAEKLDCVGVVGLATSACDEVHPLHGLRMRSVLLFV